jgi:hypothetical protein
MTLLYSDHHTKALLPRPLEWTARELVLIRSHRGTTRHERLGAVPLIKT